MSEFWQGFLWGGGIVFVSCWIDNFIKLRREP
jgi:hypothetical protein